MAEFRAPKGMLDILPPDSARWERLVAAFANLAGRSGFGLAVTPVIEHIEVFLRLGDSTDVVRKEMYDFKDKSDRHIAVRPELTASLMRAFVEHRPTTPWKAWTIGPNFRYERPQAGRYRQHFQVDAEIVGTHDPDADIEVITLLDGFHRALGLQQRTIYLNSLGDASCRPAYRAALVAYFESRLDELSEESRTTLGLNPLRVLDSKREPDQVVIEGAPRMVDYLSDDAGVHFERVTSGLSALGLSYELNNRLVRGFDYYTDTIFEIASHALPGSQNAIGGGGRYNGLVEQLGGPAGTGGVGFGAGVERILLACDAEASFASPEAPLDIFIVDTSGSRQALLLSQELRDHGFRVDRAFDGRSMKSQMRAADRSGATHVVIVGSVEVEADIVQVLPLRGRGNQQQPVPTSLLIEFLHNNLRKQRS
jgi:histidyl-tRNA synthetase